MSREKAEEMENRLNFLLPATYDRPPSQMILFIFAAGDVDDDGDDDVAYGYFGHSIGQVEILLSMKISGNDQYIHILLKHYTPVVLKPVNNIDGYWK